MLSRRYITQCLDLLNAGSDRATEKDGEVYENAIALAFGEDDFSPYMDAEKDFGAYVLRASPRVAEPEGYREYLPIKHAYDKEFNFALLE